MKHSAAGSSGLITAMSTVSEFCLFKNGDVIRGEYRGSPLVSVYLPLKKQGAFVRISRISFSRDLKAIKDKLKSMFGDHFDASALEVKVIAAEDCEKPIRDALTSLGMSLRSFAKFSETEPLECYFHSDSGRLRVAPLSGPVSEKAQPANRVVSIKKELLSKSQKSRVLIVDDSKTMRQLLRRMIEGSPNLEVVGEAERPSQVQSLIEELNPDVMTLDINMPEMTGVDLLRELLPKRFIPTVMISSLSMEDGNQVLNALELGAVDYIQKPSAAEMATVVPLIHEKIYAASLVQNPHKRGRSWQEKSTRKIERKLSSEFTNTQLIAIGASTGGTEAIKTVFMSFPKDIPPIVVVQHIPPYFSTAFAQRLNQICQFEVREAKDGDEVRAGLALIAPGGLHMEVQQKGGRLFVRVFDGPAVNRFKPSVDVLFSSVARILKGKATGVLLTGMGSDGAKGLLEMKKSGSYTIAQDEESCVVFGMPRAAIEIGAAVDVRPLEDISESLMRAA